VTMLAELVDVVIGVDTHRDTHTAAVVMAPTGAAIATATVSADPVGYTALVALADRHGRRRAWSIEGTGSYGAGLTRHLTGIGEHVIEIERPNRARRRNGAKDDTIDAVRAGREALARSDAAQPRAAGQRAALATLLAARRSAIDAATDAQRQLNALAITAPETLRTRLRGQKTRALLNTAAKLRIQSRWDLETTTAAATMRSLARRSAALEAEAAEHEAALRSIVERWRPDLLDQTGIGPIVAAAILCAWSHPGRFRSEAAFAQLAGVAPIPASSGLTTRHRLNRSGDRQLNRALHVIAIQRLRLDPRTIAYRDKRRADGKTDREIRRCLKRYIARDLYRMLEHPA